MGVTKVESGMLRRFAEEIETWRQKRQAAAEFLRSQFSVQPTIGLILGTGLGSVVERLEQQERVPYEAVPYFPASTVQSHSGQLVAGILEGKPVLAMQGRMHYYEGYSMKEITFPVRVMRELGISTLIIASACGSMNPLIRKGSVMLVTDHINLMGDNPLIGPNDEELGPRFPDMSEPYSRRLLQLAEQVALEKKIRVEKGVYVALSGPNLETPAEYRFLRIIGADAVGMSMVPEVLVARHMNMEVLGFGIVTDECYPEALQPLSLEEVIKVAGETEPKMAAIIAGVVAAL